MAERKINGLVKAALEFGPLVAFFIAYFCLRGQTLPCSGWSVRGSFWPPRCSFR